MATARKDLKAFTVYYVRSAEMYFATPDGFGGYWYETLEAAQDDYGKTEVIHIDDLED